MNGRVSVESESDLRGGDGGPDDGEAFAAWLAENPGERSVAWLGVDASLSQRDVEGFEVWLARNPGERSVAWALGHGPVDVLGAGEVFKGRPVLWMHADLRGELGSSRHRYAEALPGPAYAAALLMVQLDKWVERWGDGDVGRSPREANDPAIVAQKVKRGVRYYAEEVLFVGGTLTGIYLAVRAAVRHELGR